MIFEFSIAKKYLIPKKGQLSTSLISLISVGVISLIVWLILTFLSITNGIEKTWINKLTSFNAPIHIIPTENYYHSYYYQIDSISNASNFCTKSIGEKATTCITDPYNDDDMELPLLWPKKVCNKDGSTKDLVKEVFHILDEQKLIAQDYEISGAIVKLHMIRPQNIPFSSLQEDKNQRCLTQVSYISSFCGKSPKLATLIEPPRMEDLNHLFFLTQISSNEIKEDLSDQAHSISIDNFQKRIQSLLSHVTIQKMQNISHRWQSLAFVLPEGIEFDANAFIKQGKPSAISIPLKKGISQGKLVKRGGHFLFIGQDGIMHEVQLTIPLFIEGTLSIDVALRPPIFSSLLSLRDLHFDMKACLQGHTLQGQIPWEDIEIVQAETKSVFNQEPDIPPPWPYIVHSEAKLPYNLSNDAPVILPKHFQNSGIKIGDVGYFGYGAPTITSIQEQRLPLYVAGFYDPGVMSIGAKYILTTSEVVHAINTSSQESFFDSNMVNGIQVYLPNLSQAKEVKTLLIKAFDKVGLLPYFTITTFHEYDFAKDLLQQFQSDKYLFTLIGLIVLLVACSNIISLLIILIKDKKREIAVLSSMGASKISIGWIFTLCGGIMGVLGTIIGTIAAFLTLHNIDTVINLLSFLQGHELFNTMFYEKSLPNELSSHALILVVVATPIISLLAGFIPAIKACKLSPSQILRCE